jgi:hypothetical protein
MLEVKAFFGIIKSARAQRRNPKTGQSPSSSLHVSRHYQTTVSFGKCEIAAIRKRKPAHCRVGAGLQFHHFLTLSTVYLLSRIIARSKGMQQNV